VSVKQLRKLYSVWKNDEADTLIAIDETAERCAALMGIKLHNFYTYVSRPSKLWTIRLTGKEKKQ